jgi:hypothetical protein
MSANNWFSPHVGAGSELAGEEEAQIDFGVVAGGCAAGDKATANGEAGDAVVPSGGAYVFEDDVDAAFVGDATDFVANFLRFVIDEVLGAELFGFFQLGVVARGGDDARAEERGDLNGGTADSAASAEN